MKKLIVIIYLCLLQAACSTQPVVAGGQAPLLSFSELANEITVDYRDDSTSAEAVADVEELLDTP